MTPTAFDRDLLFGILALQMDFTTRDDLIQSLQDRALEQDLSLGELLVERRQITRSQCAALEQMVIREFQRCEADSGLESTHLAGGGLSAESAGPDDDDMTADELLFTVQADTEIRPALLTDMPLVSFEPDSQLDLSEDVQQEGLTVEEPAQREMRFQILRPHAEGGIGMISVAVDREFNREVAFKEIKRQFRAQKGARKRFLLEAEVTARLEHPGIVPVYGLGHFQDGRPFYAMRLIRGETLKESIQDFHRKRASTSNRRRRSRRAYGNDVQFRELISRFIDVCFAIEYAHSRGVLHRDLKPGNIMLGQYGETLVVDWGLAKVTGFNDDTSEGESDTVKRPEGSSDAGSESLMLLVPATGECLTETNSGSAIGTPDFMSPEQAEGRLNELDTTTDIYSLGATLYQLITGLTPVTAESGESRPVRLRRSEVLERVRTGRFPRPRQVNPDVSPGLEAVCLKAMSLNPEDRYQSAQELLQELRAWMANEPVRAWREPLTVRTRRWVRGHQLAVGIAVTALLILAAVSPVMTIQKSQYAARQAENAQREGELRKQAEEERLAAVEARDAQTELVTAANRSAEEARRNLRIAEKNSYSSDMRLVQMNWENANVGPIVETINRHRGRHGLKGFEWGYWNRLTHSELQSLKGHSANVTSVSFSPDGQQLAASADTTVRVWNLATGQETMVLTGFARYLKCVAFSPDGTQLATAGAAKSVTVWNAADGQERHSLTGHTDLVSCVSFSPDGTQIVSCSHDQTLKLWDAAIGKVLRTIPGHTRPVNCVAFTPDGKRIVSGSADGTVRTWDAATGKLLSTLEDYNVTALAVSPDGDRLATGSTNSTITLWDVAGEKKIQVLDGHTHRLQSVAFSPDGRQLASGSADRTVRVWNVASGKQTMILKGHARTVFCVAFSPDGTRLASPGHGSTVKLWNVQTGQDTLTFTGHTGALNCAKFSPDGESLVSAGEDGTIRVWETETGQTTRILTGHAGSVPDVAFHPNGKWLASAGADTTVRLWDAATGKERYRLEGHEKNVSSVSFSPDGTRLVSAGSERQVIVWETASGQKIQTLTARSGAVSSVCFSPDGQQLAISGADRIVNLWDLKTQQFIRPFDGHTGRVHQVSFSSDGKRLVTASADGTAVVWEVVTGEVLQRLKGHTNAVLDVSFSPDGKRVTTGSRDTTVKVWDTSSGQELLTMKGHRDWVTGVRFSPGGLRLASTGADGTIKIWDARPRTTE